MTLFDFLSVAMIIAATADAVVTHLKWPNWLRRGKYYESNGFVVKAYKWGGFTGAMLVTFAICFVFGVLAILAKESPEYYSFRYVPLAMPTLAFTAAAVYNWFK